MNHNLKIIPLLAILTGCVHSVHSLEVESDKKVVIESALTSACASEKCELGSCWQETKDIVFCEVEFSFIDDERKKEVLSVASLELHDNGIYSGFCARNSLGTRMAYALVEGVVGGVVAVALGGGTPMSVTVPVNPSTNVTPDVQGSSVAKINLNEACDESRTRVLAEK